MGFFTTNWNLGNAFNNPSVGRTQPFMPGAGSLSATQNINPFQWTPQASGQRQNNWGAPNSSAGTGNSYNFAGSVGSQNPFAPMYGGFGGDSGMRLGVQPPWWQNQQQQQPINQSQQRGMSPRPQSDGGSDYEDTTSATPADRTPQGYQDYFNYGRNTLTGIGSLFGPLGAGLTMAGDYNMGFNTFSPNSDENLGFDNPLTGNYNSFYNDNYAGPGHTQDNINMSKPSEQRDMLINQLAYDMQPDNIRGGGGPLGGFFGGMLGGNTLNYDIDSDISGPWTAADNAKSVPNYNTLHPNYWTGAAPLANWQTEEANAVKTFGPMTPMSIPGTVQFQDKQGVGYESAPASTPWSNPSISDLPSAPDTTSSVDFGNYSADVTNLGGGYYSSVDESAPAGYQDIGWEDPNPSSDDGGSSGGGGGGSYIATAATQALGEGGLKVFEDWRDYMHSWHPTFTASFGRYRVTAPKIVEEINKSDNPKGIYNYIWDMHLKPIFDLISEDKDSKKALKDYKIMVRELSNKFLRKEKV
jgi:hypothetical protein